MLPATGGRLQAGQPTSIVDLVEHTSQEVADRIERNVNEAPIGEKSHFRKDVTRTNRRNVHRQCAGYIFGKDQMNRPIVALGGHQHVDGPPLKIADTISGGFQFRKNLRDRGSSGEELQMFEFTSPRNTNETP